MDKVNLAEKLAPDAHYHPGIVATMNEHKVQVVKVKGEFPWHTHAPTTSSLVLDGELQVQLRDRTTVLGPRRAPRCARGVENRPYAETHIPPNRPLGTPNTGDGARTERTAAERWI